MIWLFLVLQILDSGNAEPARKVVGLCNKENCCIVPAALLPPEHQGESLAVVLAAAENTGAGHRHHIPAVASFAKYRTATACQM